MAVGRGLKVKCCFGIICSHSRGNFCELLVGSDGFFVVAMGHRGRVVDPLYLCKEHIRQGNKGCWFEG